MTWLTTWLTRPTASLLLLSIFLSALLAAPATEALPSRWERWHAVDTTHFTLLGNAERDTMVQAGRDLEQLRAVLSQISRLQLDPPTPTTIYVFKNAKSMAPYAHRTPDGTPRRLGGAFFRNPHANHILIDGESPGKARALIFHEYVHFFISYNLPAVPLWFEEGLAEVYATFESDGRRAHIGKAVTRHLQWLRVEPWIPLEELMAVDRTSPIYNENARQGSFYAQSWLLAHYLMHGRSDDGSALGKLLHGLRRLPPPEALRRSLNMEPRDLERTLRRYAAQDVHLSKRLPVDASTPADSAWRRLSRAETLVALGDLLAVQIGRRAEAEQHFQGALKLDPERDEAWLGLGLTAERDEDWGAAIAAYERALAAKPGNALAATLKARARLSQGEDPRLVRGALKRITRDHPERPLGWQMLAATYGHSSVTPAEGREGIRAFRKALELAPEHLRLARALHRFYVWLDLPEEADALERDYFRPRGLSVGGRP